MKRTTAAAGLALGALVLTMGQVVTADAATTVKTLSCSKGGFTGTMYVRGTARDVSLYYKINKGSNRGGNKADVLVNDNGVAPTKTISLYAGIQDNQEHFYASYHRGNGGMGVTFVFDKSSAVDPTCGTSASF